jgi:adenylate cyclase
VDALSCAVQVQKDLGARNESLPDERKVRFRIGVNLGDVIEDRDDIYGDGVNVSARLESLAEPGGICVSESVRTAIGERLPLVYEFMGAQQVKNIAHPVRAYRAHPAGQRAKQTPETGPTGDGATSVKATQESLTPSVAVLPFNAIGGDPEDQRLADGITDNLINALSRTEHYLVPDRTSLFAYQGLSPRPSEVAESLGVGHVLEGSVQRFGDQARITVQLADATTGHQVWSDRIDRTVEDVFGLQDDLAKHVAMALRVVLLFGEAGRNWIHHGVSLEVCVLIMRCTVYLLKSTREDVARAREIGEEIMRLEPDFAAGPVNTAWAHWIEAYFGWSAAPEESLDIATKLARRAIELDPDNAEAWILLAQTHLMREQFEQATGIGEKALELSPHDPFNMAMLAWTLVYAGEAQRAGALATKAIHLFPQPPDFVYRVLGLSHQLVGRHEEALDAFEQATSRCGGDPTMCLAYEAVVLSELERAEEARAKMAQVLALTPDLCMKKLRYMTGFRDPATRERFRTALLDAGVSG